MAWANREIVPNLVTVLNTWLPPRPQIPAKGPCSYPHSQTSDPLLSVSLFFRSVAHGAEKIVFITCQHLAALSYATQDSIKLSYTGMKLQNRPGTPQQNYLFFFPVPKIQRSIFSRDFFFDRQRDAGLDMMKKKRMEKGHFGETVLHTCGMIKKKVLEQL